jgi:hypothetical protein
MSSLSLVLACAAGASAATGSAFDLMNRWGVAMHYRHAGRPGETEMLSKGFKVARTDAVWAEVEYASGKFNFSNFDALVAELEAHDVQPMLVLTSWGNPKFYNQLLPHDTHTRQEFVDYSLAMMQRFKGRKIIWELWNEPNIPNAAFPAWSAQQYGELAVQLGKAMQTAGLQSETLVGPALSGMLRDSSFLEGVFATGALNYLDAITVHPYFDTPENAIYGDDCWGGLRYLMQKHGYAVKPVISSEWGWNTCQKPCTKVFGNYGLTENTQAHFLARQWLTNWFHGVPSIFYEFNTFPGNDPHSGEDNFGVVRYDYHNESYPYTPKPAYVAAVTLQNLFGSLDKVQRIDSFGLANMVLRAYNSQGNVSYAVWKASVPVMLRKGALALEEDIHHIQVSPPGCYTFHTMLGKILETKCTSVVGQAIEVVVTSDPVYLVLGDNATAAIV